MRTTNTLYYLRVLCFNKLTCYTVSLKAFSKKWDSSFKIMSITTLASLT